MNKQRALIIAICLIPGFLLMATDLAALEKNPRSFGTAHYAGARVGAWVMTGTNDIEDYQGNPIDFAGSSLYAEFFYAHRLNPRMALEFSIGIFSQGDIEYLTTEETLLGTVNVYPFLISGKVYPLTGIRGTSWYPYLRLGGGVVYGNRDATSTYYYYDDYFLEESQLKITYMVGAGIDWPVADQIGLNLDFKYVPVKFGKALAGFRDYSGWELTFGIGYIFRSR